MKKAQKGFTLIELLVVIAIIGVLSTLAVVSLNNARAKSRDSKRVSDVKQVQNALELYFNENSGYPATAAAGITLGGASTGALSAASGFTSTTTASGDGSTVFMQQVPAAPQPYTDGTCTAATAVYTYISTASSSYSINYCVGSKTGSIPAGVNKACQSGVTGC